MSYYLIPNRRLKDNQEIARLVARRQSYLLYRNPIGAKHKAFVWPLGAKKVIKFDTGYTRAEPITIHADKSISFRDQKLIRVEMEFFHSHIQKRLEIFLASIGAEPLKPNPVVPEDDLLEGL